MTSDAYTTADTPPLKQYAAIRVSGADRSTFLQGQLSNDLRLLTPHRPLLAGWANPQGRLICIVWAIDWQESIWLLLPAELRDAVAKRLKMFVLRANVQIEAAPHQVEPVLLHASKIQPVVENNDLYSCFYNDNYCTLMLRNNSSMGLQLSLASGSEADADLHSRWQLEMIRAGIPVIWNSTSGEFVPQMVNLDLLGGISFTKGCYVGQEIVARTQNLGRIKRRMFAYSVRTLRPVKPGDIVFSSDGKAGQIVNCEHSASDTVELLAVIRLDCVDAPLRLDPDGQEVLHSLPLPYPMPEIAI